MRYLNGQHPLNPLDSVCENYYVAMPSSSDLGVTKTASTKTKSNSTIVLLAKQQYFLSVTCLPASTPAVLKCLGTSGRSVPCNLNGNMTNRTG